MAETLISDSANIEQLSEDFCSLCSKPIFKEEWAHRIGRGNESIILCERCWCLET